MTFNKWLDTLVSEKDWDLDQDLETRRGNEVRYLPLSFVVEHMKVAPAHEQAKIKAMVVRIDFANGNILDFFAHLGAALWEQADQFVNL